MWQLSSKPRERAEGFWKGCGRARACAHTERKLVASLGVFDSTKGSFNVLSDSAGLSALASLLVSKAYVFHRNMFKDTEPRKSREERDAAESRCGEVTLDVPNVRDATFTLHAIHRQGPLRVLQW